MAVSIDDSGRLLRLAPLPSADGAGAAENLASALNELEAESGDLAILDEGAETGAWRELAKARGLRVALASRTAREKGALTGQGSPKGPEGLKEPGELGEPEGRKDPGELEKPAKGEKPKLSWRHDRLGLKWKPLEGPDARNALSVKGALAYDFDGEVKPRSLDFRLEANEPKSPEELWKAVKPSLAAERTLRTTDLKNPRDSAIPLAMTGFLAGRLLDHVVEKLSEAGLVSSWTEVKAIVSEHVLYTGSKGRRRASCLPEARPYYETLGAPPNPSSSPPLSPKG